MKLRFAFCILQFALCNVCCAQVLVLGRSSLVDIERELHCERGPAAAAANSAKLNAAMTSGNIRAPFFIPEGDWYFGADTVNSNINGTCVLTPAVSGLAFIGSGIYRIDDEGSPSEGASARILYGGPRIDLSQATHSCTGANITITSGYAPKSQDVGATVNIIGGSNFTPDSNHGSFYRITAVNGNVWTVDRSVVSSGPVTNLTGSMTYSLWRDQGYGNLYQGLAFKGHEDYQATPRCHVGVHVLSSLAGGGELNKGKHVFFGCSWSSFTACVMTGKSMERAYAMATTYDGYDGNHADHLSFLCCGAQEAETFFYLRNGKSVNHVVRDFRNMINIYDSIIYAERGGQMLVEHMGVGGSRGVVLRVGIPTSNNGQFYLVDITQDADPNNAAPKMLAIDAPGDPPNPANAFYRVTFDGVHIDDGLDNWSVPIFEARAGCRLTIRDANGLRPGDILMQFDNVNPPNPDFYPYVVVEGAFLEGFNSSPNELLNTGESSVPFGTLKWRDCTNHNNTAPYADNQIQDL